MALDGLLIICIYPMLNMPLEDSYDTVDGGQTVKTQVALGPGEPCRFGMFN